VFLESTLADENSKVFKSIIEYTDSRLRQSAKSGGTHLFGIFHRPAPGEKRLLVTLPVLLDLVEAHYVKRGFTVERSTQVGNQIWLIISGWATKKE
jgi:hypothetical protein